MWSWVCVQLRYQVERQSHPWDPYHMMQMACCCCCSLSQSFVSLSSDRKQGGLATDWSNLITLVGTGLSQTRSWYTLMYMQPTLRVKGFLLYSKATGGLWRLAKPPGSLGEPVPLKRIMHFGREFQKRKLAMFSGFLGLWAWFLVQNPQISKSQSPTNQKHLKITKSTNLKLPKSQNQNFSKMFSEVS